MGQEDPGADYEMVRHELMMYNPEYSTRPHIVALNKMDLPDAAELRAEVQASIWSTANRLTVCPYLNGSHLPLQIA